MLLPVLVSCHVVSFYNAEYSILQLNTAKGREASCYGLCIIDTYLVDGWGNGLMEGLPEII